MTITATLEPGQGALHVFRRLCVRAPERPFLRVDGVRLNRREFLDQVSLWAGAFSRQGVVAGDYVALITPNSMQWCVAFWALVSVGARPVPLDPQIGGWELENLLQVIGVKLCLAVPRYRSSPSAENLERIRSQLADAPILVSLDGHAQGLLSCEEFLRDACPLPVPNRTVEPDEPLMLACTSGTTGNPKIISVPHAGFVRSQLDMGRVLGATDSDRMLLGMPLYHQGGFGMGLQVLVSGGESIYEVGFDPHRFLETMESERVTVVQLSATLAKLQLSHPQFDAFELSTLRLCYFAGEVLPDRLAAEFWDKRRKRVINVIGSSETATMVMRDSSRDSHRSASEYRALPFTAVHVGQTSPNSTHSDATHRDAPATSTEPGSLWVSTDALILFTGMDFLHPSLLNRLRARLPGLDRAVSAYGLVETSTVFMTWKAHDVAQMAGPLNVFALCPSVANQVDVHDESGASLADGLEGELWVKGPSVVSGYLGQPSGPPAFVDGWFRTGDVARRVDATQVELCGRSTYLIKRGGKSISPIEVQDRIVACKGVRTSVVVGVKHPLYGEMIWALVVSEPDGAATLTELMRECRANLPVHMVPDQVTFVRELPRGSGVGKLDREAMIRMAIATDPRGRQSLGSS